MITCQPFLEVSLHRRCSYIGGLQVSLLLFSHPVGDGGWASTGSLVVIQLWAYAWGAHALYLEAWGVTTSGHPKPPIMSCRRLHLETAWSEFSLVRISICLSSLSQSITAGSTHEHHKGSRRERPRALPQPKKEIIVNVGPCTNCGGQPIARTWQREMPNLSAVYRRRRRAPYIWRISEDAPFHTCALGQTMIWNGSGHLCELLMAMRRDILKNSFKKEERWQSVAQRHAKNMFSQKMFSATCS